MQVRRFPQELCVRKSAYNKPQKAAKTRDEMDDAVSLSAELRRDFRIEADELSPELRICVERIDALRRREQAPPVGLIAPATSDFPIEIAIAVTHAQREQIFDLRARAYRQAGWLSTETQRVEDEFDALPSSILLMASSAERIVGTVRVSISDAGDPACSMPCQHEFPADLAALHEDHDRLAEFCRVAVDPTLPSRSFRTTLYGSLVRAATMTAHAAEVDYALAAVHAKLSLFYQHMCGFHRVAKAPGYGSIKEPTHLLGAEFAQLLKRTLRRSEFFHLSRMDMATAQSALAATHPSLCR